MCVSNNSRSVRITFNESLVTYASSEATSMRITLYDHALLIMARQVPELDHRYHSGNDIGRPDGEYAA